MPYRTTAVVLIGSLLPFGVAAGQAAPRGAGSPGVIVGEVAAGSGLVKVSADLPIRRYVVRHGENEGAVADGAARGDPVGTLVYSNTNSSMPYASGFAYYLGDDVRTVAVCECNVSTLVVKVTGGGDGTTQPGPSFGYALYPDCPTGGGVNPIAGTAGEVVLVDDGVWVLEIDYSANPPPISRSLWIGLYPSVGMAGWFVGSAPELGFSGNFYEHPLVGCSAWFGGSTYASFYAQIYCAGDDSPTTAVNPYPADGASNVHPDTNMSWSGAASRSEAPSVDPLHNEVPSDALDDHKGPAVPIAPPACSTYEHYLATEGPVERDSAGGCPLLGSCDVPDVRDVFVPEPDAPITTFRLMFHVFCYDNGSGCVSSTSAIDTQMADLNADYLPVRIQFIHDLLFHNDTQYRDVLSGDINAMKSAYAISPDARMNIFVAYRPDSGYSYGTFPWSSAALTATGGIMLHSDHVNVQSLLSHEVGHVVGLWHTFHGVDEASGGCLSPCYEEAGNPSDTTGDFCSDTPPTPLSYLCGDPPDPPIDNCSGLPWAPTAYRNYMSYAGCRDEWSTQQMGRTHCWSEEVLSGWMEEQCIYTYDMLLETTDPPTNVICSGIEETTCDPGPLDCDTTYYWRVVSHLIDGSANGPVWSFSTPGGGDCNGNSTPDLCEIAIGDAEDCNSNELPDGCDLADCVDDPACADCNSNSTPDSCDIDSHFSDDTNTNGVPDECEDIAKTPGLPPSATHQAPKHRYLSIDTSPSVPSETALRVDLISLKRCSGDLSRSCIVNQDCELAVPGSGDCIEHSDAATAGPWWVQAPQQEPQGCIPGPCGDEDWFARVDSMPHFEVWTLDTLHVGDCEIIPVAEYEIRACLPPDGVVCSDPLTIGTIAQPFVSPGFRGNYGDAAGPVDAITEEFIPPDGITNVVDVFAYVNTKQNYGTANKPQTHPTWVDLHGPGDGQPPQYILNVSDMGQILKGFAGDAWTDDPGNMNPGECP